MHVMLSPPMPVVRRGSSDKQLSITCSHTLDKGMLPTRAPTKSIHFSQRQERGTGGGVYSWLQAPWSSTVNLAPKKTTAGTRPCVESFTLTWVVSHKDDATRCYHRQILSRGKRTYVSNASGDTLLTRVPERAQELFTGTIAHEHIAPAFSTTRRQQKYHILDISFKGATLARSGQNASSADRVKYNKKQSHEAGRFLHLPTSSVQQYNSV